MRLGKSRRRLVGQARRGHDGQHAVPARRPRRAAALCQHGNAGNQHHGRVPPVERGDHPRPGRQRARGGTPLLRLVRHGRPHIDLPASRRLLRRGILHRPDHDRAHWPAVKQCPRLQRPLPRHTHGRRAHRRGTHRDHLRHRDRPGRTRAVRAHGGTGAGADRAHDVRADLPRRDGQRRPLGLTPSSGEVRRCAVLDETGNRAPHPPGDEDGSRPTNGQLRPEPQHTHRRPGDHLRLDLLLRGHREGDRGGRKPPGPSGGTSAGASRCGNAHAGIRPLSDHPRAQPHRAVPQRRREQGSTQRRDRSHQPNNQHDHQRIPRSGQRGHGRHRSRRSSRASRSGHRRRRKGSRRGCQGTAESRGRYWPNDGLGPTAATSRPLRAGAGRGSTGPGSAAPPRTPPPQPPTRRPNDPR